MGSRPLENPEEVDVKARRGFTRAIAFTFLLILLVSLIAWIPLYGILIPPSADLSQHILVNKILWEKLSGTSHLDLEVSLFMGYRLLSMLIVALMSVCQLLGLSFVLIPKLTLFALLFLHAAIIVGCIYPAIPNGSLKSGLFAVALSTPAVVSMYSASWFTGFVGFTLGVTLLVPAIFLLERYVSQGRLIDNILHLIVLILVYMAHPFVVVFSLLWGLSRAFAGLARPRSWLTDIKRLLILGLTSTPVAVYHLVATSGGGAAMSAAQLSKESPFTSLDDWYRLKASAVLSGSYLQADNTADSHLFAIGAIALVCASVVFALSGRASAGLRKVAVTNMIFLLLSSFMNEKFFPVPPAHWLAYDLRWGTTAYVVSLSISAFVLVRTWGAPGNSVTTRIVYTVIALIALLASLLHVHEVQGAYARFDKPAREYLNGVFDHTRPTDEAIPRTAWQSDGNFLKLYGCLKQPDCDPAGTLFRKLGGDIYPLRVKSDHYLTSGDEPPFDPRVEPVNVFLGAEGYGRGYMSRPRGIAVDAAGNIYVADNANARVQKFGPDGEFIFATGQYGKGPGKFQEPSGVAVGPDGSIYVVDALERKLVRLSHDGVIEKEWSGPTIGFQEPRDIAIGPNGTAYILDLALGRVITFDLQTELFSVWMGSETDDERMVRPTGIECSGGLVLVAELGSDQIRIFDLTGKPIRTFPVPAWGKYVWHYPDLVYDDTSDRIYATNGWRKEVLVFNAKGESIGSLALTTSKGTENLSSVAMLKEGRSARLYLLNMGSEVSGVIDPDIFVAQLP